MQPPQQVIEGPLVVQLDLCSEPATSASCWACQRDSDLSSSAGGDSSSCKVHQGAQAFARIHVNISPRHPEFPLQGSTSAFEEPAGQQAACAFKAAVSICSLSRVDIREPRAAHDQ
eukprot:720867-Pleurochrysis_carterae.AAC.1